MTENEAIKEIETSLELAEMCKPNREREKEIKAYKMAIQALGKVQQFEAIGTIEEFKALKEKNTPYKPQEYEDRYYACKCDNILLPKWRKYPTELMPKSEGLPHCMACGQKLDWSE